MLAVSAAALPAFAEQSGVVNINTATAEQLARLPGIGEAKARAILEARREVGPFESAEDLLVVKGIGNSALEKLRRYVVVEGRTTLE